MTKALKSKDTTSYFSISIICLFACAWGVFVLGPKPLNIYETNWLWHDLAQVYLAWAQYTSDPNAHWLMSSRLSYPLELNFALFDPLPIFLLTFGKLSSLLPDKTQYFGIYFLFCLNLQGILGYLITKKIITFSNAPGIEVELYCIISASFFILAPYTFYRFQQHIALASHWVILFSIWVSLCTLSSKTILWVLLNCLVVLIATGINPYLTLMVLISQSFITIFAFFKKSQFQILLRICMLLITTIVGFKIFGFLSASGVRDFGYGVFSMNMLGPFNSNGWATLLPLNITDATGGQAWEGFNYQGLGVLILLIFAIFLKLKNKIIHHSLFPYRAALSIICFSYLLALSTTITISSIIFKPYVPSIANHFLSIFRASGRLFWVGDYWLILAGIATLPIYLSFKKSTYILFIFFIIQVIDVSGVGWAIRNKISTIQRTTIQAEAITMNPERYDALVVLPPWQCNTEKTAGGGNNYEYLGFFAADHKISTNNFYAARILPEQTEFHCAASTSQPTFIKNMLYVISPDFFKNLTVESKEKLKCSFNNEHTFHLCTSL